VAVEILLDALLADAPGTLGLESRRATTRSRTWEAPMRCSRCDGDDCIQIEIRLKVEGDRVQFFSCRRCESKWWERGGTSIALDEVLDLAARNEGR
jgi:hypothetical protein